MTQSTQDLAKVQAFYYGKIAEGMSFSEAGSLIQVSNNDEITWDTLDISYRPNWTGDYYRIKPQTTQHPGGEYPTPVSKDEVVEGEMYYYPDHLASTGVEDCQYYSSNSVQATLLARGCLHKTEEAAIQHFNVLFPQAKA